MRVAGHISLAGGEALTPRALEGLLRDIIEEADSKAISIDWIQKLVAEHFDIRLADMTSHRRPAHIAMPRQIAMYLCKHLTHASLPEIGRSFGGKHHSTVIHSIRKVEDMRTKGPDFNSLIGSFLESIR